MFTVVTRALLPAAAALCVGAVAHAQINLVGYWNPIFHEDFEERVPGPAIGDYLGLPITDAARLRAESWDPSLLSLPEHQCKVPFVALPTDTFFVDQKDIYLNGEAVQTLHQPAAHTNGDSIVHFRGSDVIAAGDLAVPADKQEGGTYVVPGHGRLADEADIVEYRDMRQIQMAEPSRDYDGRYGADSGFWPTEQFIAAIYGNLRGRAGE